MNQNNHSRGNNAAQSGSNPNGKWALNVQDIIKRTHQNMQQEKRLNSDSSELISHQKSTSSQNLVVEGGQRMRTLQQQSQDAYDPVTRGKSRDRGSNDKLNTIQHPQQRQTSKQRSKGAAASSAAQVLKQNQGFAKQSIDHDTQSHQKSRQSSQGPGLLSAEPSTQGQGGRQANLSQLAGKNQPGQGLRGTTPLRMGKQNTAKSANAGVAGQISQKVGQKKKYPQTTQNAAQKSKNNNQQIKGIMAAALASVKANQGIQQSQNVTKSQQKMMKNADLDSNRQDQFLNFQSDSNELKIMKASSVNNKYMTELIQGQKMMPEDMRAPAAARDVGSEYINTDEDEENPQPVPVVKQNSSPLRQSTYSRPPKSEDRKVFSQQDYNEIYTQEQFNQYPMGQIGSAEDRGRSQGTRPQSSYLPKHYSVERQPPAKIAFTDQKVPKKGIASPQREQEEVLRLLQKHETTQSQLNQRLDIFEEEIIKRVREIQKYSKGLNSLVRKSVMPDLQAVQEKVVGLAISPSFAGGQKIGVMEDQLVQIQQQLEMQKVMVKNMQLNMGADVNDKFYEIQRKVEGLKTPKGDNEIQQKLVEQNQLIGMLDEQLNSQEQQIQGIQAQIAERDGVITQLLENQNQQPAGQNPDISGMLNEFEETISQQLQAKFSDLEIKIQEIEQNQVKFLEDSEGRDGLILQQNQDITNLYQANEQILENEKAFKEQIESMEAQIIEQAEILEGQGANKGEGQIEGLKLNIEGRLQICIKQLQEEMRIADSRVMDGLQDKMGQIQQYSENLELKFNELCKYTQTLQENSESLELQFQAQFDEQNSQQDIRLKQMEQIILRAGGSSNQQEMDAIYKKLEALEGQETPQLELILQKIDQLESQQDFKTFNQRIQALESKDVFAVFETKMSPFKNQIEDLQIEITSKCLDLSTQQDTQVNSLILEIKQIQENFEQLQDIVVQTTQDVQGLQKNDFSDALAQSKVDIEKFRGRFEQLCEKLQVEIFENTRLIQEVKQKETVVTTTSSISPDFEQKLKSLESKILSASDIELQISSLEQRFSSQLTSLDSSKDIQRLERQNEEIEIQLKNIFVQNSQQFETLKAQMSSFSRTSEVQKDLDRFEDAAGRTSDVRQDLQAQVDELRVLISERKPAQDEGLVTKIQDLQELIVNIQESQDTLQMNVKSQLDQFSNTQYLQKDSIKFEVVAGRTSDIRKDLQAQVDELALHVQKFDPEATEVLQIEIQSVQNHIQKLLVNVDDLQNGQNTLQEEIKQIQQLKSKMDVLDDDFVDLQSQVKVIESDLETKTENLQTMISSTERTTEVSQFPVVDDEQISKLIKKQQDLESKVSLYQKTTNSKLDLISMDVSSLRNFEKQSRSSVSDLQSQVESIQNELKTMIKQKQLGELLKEHIEPCSNDIITLKHLINILQDSNFQGQIDEIKSSINDAKMRFSLPMPQSTSVQEEIVDVESKKLKPASPVQSKAKVLDLSPIGGQKKFQETDDDLKSKLQNMFPEKSEKQPFEQGYTEDDIEEYDHDDFEDLPSERIEETHEELYKQEVSLPILQEDKPPIDSFQNSSKLQVEAEDPTAEEEPISINSIDLGLMTEEQKEAATDLVMQELDFDGILKLQLEEVMQAIIMRQ